MYLEDENHQGWKELIPVYFCGNKLKNMKSLKDSHIKNEVTDRQGTMQSRQGFSHQSRGPQISSSYIPKSLLLLKECVSWKILHIVFYNLKYNNIC